MEETENKNPELTLEEVDVENSSEMNRWKGNVIIFPGGGYQWHSPREGKPVARAFALAGWKPWILYYPVSKQGSEPLNLTPLHHAALAVKKIRISFPNLPVVLCGFSAGAHAAATLGVHWNDKNVFQQEEQLLIRPDAMILAYPVITAGKWAHRESMERLTNGKEQPVSERKIEQYYFSLEHYVTDQTPPTFLWHTASDQSVPVQNSLLFAEALANFGVPFELRVYHKGVHGLSLATKEVEEPEKDRYADARIARWFCESTDWLEQCLCKDKS